MVGIQILPLVIGFVEEAINYSKEMDGVCPLEWINKEWTNQDYSLYRSFFWNVTYKLIKSFYGRTDENWNNIIAWSNLMKIAPKEGGNPDTILIRAQQQMAAILFKKEIEDLQPKNVLVLTNLKAWAEPILDYNEIPYQIVAGQFVEATADLNGSKIIITKRGYLSITHEQAIAEISTHLVR